jgi:PIN domain nuclease of toxin-antitoxin system
MKPRLLLDTHVLLWAVTDPSRLDRHVADDINDESVSVYVSVETLREIVILQQKGKINYKENLTNLLKVLSEWKIQILDIKIEHVKTLENLSYPVINNKTHDDPFDRMLISQAISEHLTLVSSDLKFPYYNDKNFSLLQN